MRYSINLLRNSLKNFVSNIYEAKGVIYSKEVSNLFDNVSFKNEQTSDTAIRYFQHWLW